MTNELVPDYVNYLREDDKQEFIELRKMFTSEDYNFFEQNQFCEIMDIIKDYSVRNNDDDPRRCLVCGLCWTNTGLGVNSSHLTYLTGQPKSTINNELNNLNYQPSIFSNEVIIKIPILQGNFRELRLWSFRKNPTAIVNNINNYRLSRSETPKPHTKMSILFESTFSYEQFNIYEFQSIPSDNATTDSFYNDIFVLPMTSWEKGN